MRENNYEKNIRNCLTSRGGGCYYKGNQSYPIHLRESDEARFGCKTFGLSAEIVGRILRLLVARRLEVFRILCPIGIFGRIARKIGARLRTDFHTAIMRSPK